MAVFQVLMTLLSPSSIHQYRQILPLLLTLLLTIADVLFLGVLGMCVVACRVQLAVLDLALMLATSAWWRCPFIDREPLASVPFEQLSEVAPNQLGKIRLVGN
jgi:hypothetical protein